MKKVPVLTFDGLKLDDKLTDELKTNRLKLQTKVPLLKLKVDFKLYVYFVHAPPAFSAPPTIQPWRRCIFN